MEARDLGSIEGAFAIIAKERISGIIVLPDMTFVSHARRMAELAENARLPSVSGNLEYAEAGGLMAYTPSYFELARAAGGHVAKVLRGAKPAELPIERPTKFDLVINMKTAKRLGVPITQALLLRANRIIE
jgi:putative ABC transport system substrate-binding protein